MSDLKELILKIALENAVKYGGKCEVGSIIGRLIGEKPDVKPKLKEISKDVKKIADEINKLKAEEQVKRLLKIDPKALEPKEKIVEERKLPELPNAVKGKVLMRIAPYPSGPLHIGNARQAILNDEYCKLYNGKLLLVIDDTIGSEEKNILKEAYDLIPDGLRWLGADFDKKIIYKSDRLEIYYKHAEELIKKNAAYICKCDSEKLRDNRAKMIECECRKQPSSETMKLWKEMFKAKEGSMALRIKTSMQHPNPAFRDRVLFRISDREHPRIGKKYRIWPLLEFSWAIDDYLLGISHVIRGKELMIESDMERFIWDIFKWKGPKLLHTGLLQIEGIKLSKSKSKQEVLSGKYFGWDDPRTFSLQSLARRGIRPEAIRNFLLSLGMNQTEIKVPIDTLYMENKKIIDKKANRYFMMLNPKLIKIKNAPKMNIKAPIYPDMKDEANMKRKFSTGDEFLVDEDVGDGVYRFMHLFNFKSKSFISVEHDSKLNAKMIDWLPSSKDLINVEVMMPDGTIAKGKGESNLKDVKVDDMVQFERKFFARCDEAKGNVMKFWFAHR